MVLAFYCYFNNFVTFLFLHFRLTVGYQTLACPESFAGTNFRAMEEEVRKKVHVYANELLSCLEDFEIQGVYFRFSNLCNNV